MMLLPCNRTFVFDHFHLHCTKTKTLYKKPTLLWKKQNLHKRTRCCCAPSKIIPGAALRFSFAIFSIAGQQMDEIYMKLKINVIPFIKDRPRREMHKHTHT